MPPAPTFGEENSGALRAAPIEGIVVLRGASSTTVIVPTIAIVDVLQAGRQRKRRGRPRLRRRRSRIPLRSEAL
jgi:hypothetical protein